VCIAEFSVLLGCSRQENVLLSHRMKERKRVKRELLWFVNEVCTEGARSEVVHRTEFRVKG